METKYNTMLDRALKKIPKKDRVSTRFELPNPITRTVGKKITMIINFIDISTKLNRDPKHLLKFMSRELATAGSIEDTRAVFQGKFSELTVNRLVTIYTNRYVVCPICKSPDTKVLKEGKFNFLICEACGAKSSILEV
jgi:translation initiation factor 2 subunit 2